VDETARTERSKSKKVKVKNICEASGKIYNPLMTTLTLDIPAVHSKQYTVLFTTMAREYSLEDIEDIMFSLHMNRNDEASHPIAELRAKYAS
jgi:hypothetical protein